MALRKLATDCAMRLGVRAEPAVGAMASTGFGLAAWRSFATVMDGLKYAKSHEWVKVEGDVATVGISDFAQAELGDLVYVEVPEVGSSFEKGEEFGVVESVKAASEVYLPVSGEVVEANEDLAENASEVNTDPFGKGWLVKVKMSNPSEVDDLLSSADYAASTEG